VTEITIDINRKMLLFAQLILCMYVNICLCINGLLFMITPKLTQEVTQLHADICSGLADPRRILILYALSAQPRNVSELAKEINISQPAASRHLTLLRERGLVSAERTGQSVIYRLEDIRIIEALDLLRTVLAEKLRSQADLASTAYDTLSS
jgi:ArsR family transcriptional regulator